MGEPGTGKTMIKTSINQNADKTMMVVNISRTLHTYFNTIKMLCHAFQIDHKGSSFSCEKRLRELDTTGLPHNTFTEDDLSLIIRSCDGILRKARNLCLSCMIEAVRSRKKTIGIDNVNQVLIVISHTLIILWPVFYQIKREFSFF